MQRTAGVRGTQKHMADPIGHASTAPLVQVLQRLGYWRLAAPHPAARPGLPCRHQAASALGSQHTVSSHAVPLPRTLTSRRATYS